MDSLETATNRRDDGQLSFSFDKEFSFNSEFLSNETFDLDHPYKGMNPFDETNASAEVSADGLIFDTPKEEETLEPQAIHGPGILYSLQRGKNTFCLRGYPCAEGGAELERIEKDFDQFEKKFRAESIADIFFFPTPTLDCAEVVWEHFSNRRFPYFEDMLCNISDPGFSWWFEEQSGGFNIYFKSHGIERTDQYICLGPIGDPRITNKRLWQLHDELSKYYEFDEFSCSETTFKIRTKGESRRIGNFLAHLFLEGTLEFSSADYEALPITLKCFLEEMSFSRMFWIAVEDHLSEDLSIN